MNDRPDTVGLCRRCIHARTVPTPRSVFWRCALAETDARFERYPRLPVLACEGFERRSDGAGDPEGERGGP